jgi:hypothetical protein
LQSRDNEVNDLKSNVDLLLKGAKESEIIIDQAKTEAAREAERVEQLTESFKTKIAGLEAHIRELNEIVCGKEVIVQTLEQKLAAEVKNFENQLSDKERLLAARGGEINDLKSKLQALTGKIQEMSSFLKQAEALAIVAAQTSRTTSPSDLGKEKSADSPFKTNVAPVTSNEPTNATQQTVSPEFFDLMSQELAVITGPQAIIIIRQHIVALGESIEKFPKSRLAELLDMLSEEIMNEPLRISFRKWFVKQHI